MGLEYQQGRPYYYRSRREDDRVIHTYVGAGAVAIRAAREDAERRLELARLREEIDKRHQQVEELLVPSLEATGMLAATVSGLLIDLGMHRPKLGQWQARRFNVTARLPLKRSHTPPERMPTLEEFQDVVHRANDGDQEALGELRELLERHPVIWEHLGDLARRSQTSLILKIAEGDKGVEESVRLQVERMKEELAGVGTTLVERLAAERVIGCWLESNLVDSMHPLPQGATVRQQSHHLRIKESAQRRYDQALKSLAAIKRLLPRVRFPDTERAPHRVIPLALRRDQGASA